MDRAVKSALNQSYADLELILIDDASSDESSDISRGYKDERVRRFRRMRPGPGGYAARNLGISLARGKWVCFLDADDEWLQDHLAIVRKAVKEHPDCQGVSTGSYLQKEQSWVADNYVRKHFESHVFELCEYLQARLKGLELITTNTIALKRNFLTEGSLFPEGSALRGGDEATWLKLFLQGMKMVRLPVPTAVYHLDADNMVTAKISNATGKHPVLSRVESVLPQLDDREVKRLLCRFANRKTIAWARVIKESKGIPLAQLKRLNFQGLDMYCVFAAMAMLFLPGLVFKQLIGGVKSQFWTRRFF